MPEKATLNEVGTNPNESWRNFSMQGAIPPCLLSRDDLKVLYRLINNKQMDYRDKLLSQLSQQQNETQEQCEQRRIRVSNAFITTVLITGVNGTVVTGHGEAIFDSSSLPERILTILYDTSFSPNAQLKHMPSDRVSLLLDFSKAPLINFVSQPSALTPNNSNWNIFGETESWATSLNTRLTEFFGERKTSVGWLHKAATYDWLLLLGGFPLSLWGANKLGGFIIGGKTFPPIMSVAIYGYAFILAANIFRALFSYSRWVYPKIELESSRSPVLKHRILWGTISLGLVISAIWDGIKFLAS